MNGKRSKNDRFELVPRHRAVPQCAKLIAEAGLKLRQPFVRHLKQNGTVYVTMLVVKFEPDDRLWHDESIFADFAEESDVKCQCSQSIVAVRHADERPEGVRPLVWAHKVEIKGSRIVRQVYVTMSSTARGVSRGRFPLAGFRLWKHSTAALSSQFKRLEVRYQSIALAHNPNNPLIGDVDNRPSMRHP
jgi:hypothetical protein